MKDSFDWTILDRKLAGDASPSDLAALDEWLALDPSRVRLVEALIAERSKRAGAEPRWDLDALRRRIDDRTSPRPLDVRRSPPRVPALNLLPSSRQLSNRARIWRASGIAAALVVVVSGGLLLRRIHLQESQRAHVTPAREYTTTRGQLASIYLTDGTRVVLAPDSHVKVPEDIGDTSASAARVATREVTLEGAAYFEVVHDARRPFAVRTSAGIARDIGTEFEVRAYERTRPMRVTVVSGKVALHSLTNGSTPVASLKRGDRATFSAAGALTVVHNVDLASVVSWTKGTLVFQGTTLNEVAVELSRWYDLDVRVADTALRNQRLVLSIGDEPATDALNLIALSLDLRVDRRGRVVTLSRPNHGK